MYQIAQSLNMPRMVKRTCLRPESARSLLHAERFARRSLQPLNTAITIEFSSNHIRGKSAYEVFQNIWENTRRAWNYQNGKGRQLGSFDSIAVFENPPQSAYNGRVAHGPYHVHWLLRWPQEDLSKLERRIRRALKRINPMMPGRCLKVTPAYKSVGFVKYMAKGIDKPFAAHFYLKHRPQGPIDHRRIIISRSLGQSARKLFMANTGRPCF